MSGCSSMCRPLLGLGLLAASLAAGCGQGQEPAKAAGPVEVIVTKPITDQVTDYQDFTGRLNAFETVEIRARVTGYVKSAPFKEGDLVSKGKVLFEIDPRSYLADLNLAKANLKLAVAERNVQERNANRAQNLIRTRAVASEEYDQILAALEKEKATVEAMEATRERTQLYLDWTTVKAPLSGRVSRHLVDPGNLVVADTTVLTTIVTESPLYAYFDVDERTFLDLVGSGLPSEGVSPWQARLQVPVLMRLANEEQFTHAGTVDFVDNQVSPTSGTIRMRGVFENPRGVLRPGLFARIRLPLSSPYRTVLVPDEALMSDQGRKYVYVVNAKDEIVYRKVKLGQAIQGLRVIKDGIAEGERVVVTGMQRVRPGAKVKATLQAPPPRPESPLARFLPSDRTRNGAAKAATGGQ